MTSVIGFGNTKQDVTLIDEIDFLPINKNQLGLTLNIGFNTWNISLYQSLNSFFNPEINNNIKDLKQFRLGIIFYIF